MNVVGFARRIEKIEELVEKLGFVETDMIAHFSGSSQWKNQFNIYPFVHSVY